jgi:hypothetical protein
MFQRNSKKPVAQADRKDKNMNNAKLLPLIASLYLVSFIACTNEPKEGDWYESIKTGKRHKISVLPASFELEQFNKRFDIQLDGRWIIDSLKLVILKSQRERLKRYVQNKDNLFYLSDYWDYYIIDNQPLTTAFTADEIKRDFIKIN